MIGMDVVLYERTRTGTDAFNDPVFKCVPVKVSNVLVGQPSTEEIENDVNLYGRRAEYVLGIPKGDAHRWEDSEVEFFGRRWRTFGMVIQGIEANVPTAWHRKVRVERCE